MVFRLALAEVWLPPSTTPATYHPPAIYPPPATRLTPLSTPLPPLALPAIYPSQVQDLIPTSVPYNAASSATGDSGARSLQIRLRAARRGGVEPSYLLRVTGSTARDEWRQYLAEAVRKARVAPRAAPTVLRSPNPTL